MKVFLAFFAWAILSGLLFQNELAAQSDGCSSATVISVTATCSSPVAGTTTGATQTISGCVGTADDDVWYTFTATSTNHIITVTPSVGMDPVVQLFSGACSTLISLKCMDLSFTGDAETIYATGLTPGTDYTIRVYDYYTGSGTGDFTICVTDAPAAPSNDACASATLLNVFSSCTPTSGTTVSATLSQAGCAGTADDDVWYKFVATNSVQTITVSPYGTMDPVLELFEGICGAFTSIQCEDNGFSGDNEEIQAVGLIPGTTYYIRVYDYYSSNGGGDFDICITGSPTPTPTNDDPCDAIQLPPVTSACDYLSFTTTGATTTLTAPTPASCVGGASPAQGGFNNTPQPKDVWFAITVPSSGAISIMAEPSYGFNDAVMALYSGACSSLTQIACSDDHNYPGPGNDYKPFLLATGLTPGATVYLRYWAFNGNITGDFGLCVTTPTNDNCDNALYICDLNGYEGTTSAAYTVDRPGNMRGNAEMNNPPTYTYTNGTCQGGIFGLGGAWGSGAPNCDVQINNNSWIRFTAAADTATLIVDIYDCYVGNYPSGGIQMQIFSAANPCADFVPVSDFEEGSSQLTIQANGLVMGQDYYLMIDGFAGDICSYSITASAGVQFPDITASQNPICIGDTVTLYGPAGATAYDWDPSGATSQDIVVIPSTTETYVLEVTGVCDHRQLLEYEIIVNPLPTATASNNSPLCAGDALTLNAGGGNSYVWSGPASFSSSVQNPGVSGVSTSNDGTYTVTVTDINNCSNTATTAVTVNANPVSNAGTDQTIPFGTNTGLTGSGSGGSGSYQYAWSPASLLNDSTLAAPQTTNLNSSTIYTLVVTDLTTGCTHTDQVTVFISGGPLALNANANAGGVCYGDSVYLSSLVSGGSGSYTYTWSSNPGGFSGTATDTSFVPTTTTTYTLTVYDGFNTVIDSVEVTVYPLPTASASNTGPYCEGDNIALTAGTGTGYFWSGPNSWSGSGANPAISPAQVLNSGTYYVTVSNSYGCVDTASTNVVVNAVPIAGAANTGPYCSGDTVYLQASGGGTYAWSGPQSYSSSSQNPYILNATPSQSGSYIVTVTGSGSCTATATSTVTVNDLPAVSATGAGTYCEGDSLILYANGGNQYAWSGPNSFNSSSQSPQIIPAQTSNSGIYIVTVTDVNSCSDTAMLSVLVNPNPVVQIAGDDSLCLGDLLTLTGSGANTYLWSTSETQTSIQVSPITNTVYYLTGTSAGCSASDSLSVSVFPVPTAEAGEDTTIFSGESINLTGHGGTYYEWVPSDYLSDAFIANPVCTPDENMTYVLWVYNEYGCSDSDTVRVTLESECGEIYVPNAFSPNNDGKNEEFGVFNKCLLTLELKIFNQWGNMVFESSDINARWDGTFSGKDAESGIYSYYYTGTLTDESQVEGQGNFVLIR
ncbi:MAG: gliding motility-associated C-terminal domain-containing protein [Bacteroidales bacterium]|nr:gliding motility-associated C-terminal domain-containing protein [Bacteroidales bacterium]